MKPKLIIQASNIHVGGGKTLLEAIVCHLLPDIDAVLFVDERMTFSGPAPSHIKTNRVAPTLFRRVLADYEISKMLGAGETLLCFGSLPPLFRNKGLTTLFVQNRYLIDTRSSDGFSIKTRIRLLLERCWLAWGLRNVDQIFVQSDSMKRQFELKFSNSSKIKVIPFVQNAQGFSRTSAHKNRKKEVFDFSYIASVEPHKNHKKLVEAWCILAAEGLRPSLAITISESIDLGFSKWLGQMTTKHRLEIENLGPQTHEQALNLLGKSGALIYPSTFESFGLPLIEARLAGIPIIASELDFVRDIIDPEETFDPSSAVSIARSVRRYLELPESSNALCTASVFLVETLKSGQRDQ